ncbi:MAG: hypothetical protein JSR59_04760 [Proteobacteria bacterium]|nr:hypothetical protein [Pseudomonadota bacterium]
MLLGGEPFGPPPPLWWNFVARTQGPAGAGAGRLEQRRCTLRRSTGRHVGAPGCTCDRRARAQDGVLSMPGDDALTARRARDPHEAHRHPCA